MQNPYARSQGPGPATPEAQKLADYELAIGQNVDYYMARFARFDNGESKLSWNWPAFFVTTPWFLYRKMWGWGLGNIAYFWGMLTLVAPIALGITAGAVGPAKASSAMTLVGIVIGLLMAIPWFVLPIFANALYWKHVNNVINNMPASFQQQPDKRMARILRNGGTGAGAMIGVLIGGIFVFIAIAGMLAAIAIPAYQDYTIRSQVMEGLNLAQAPKAAVAEYYAQNEEWPLDSEAAGLGPISGKYVESVTVANGSVVITFGGGANSTIVNDRLILAPGVTEQGDVAWICGERATPAEVVTVGPGPRGSDLKPKYLPSNCRP